MKVVVILPFIFGLLGALCAGLFSMLDYNHGNPHASDTRAIKRMIIAFVIFFVLMFIITITFAK